MSRPTGANAASICPKTMTPCRHPSGLHCLGVIDFLHPPRRLDSKSLSASVLDYEYENGRRYHGYKAGRMWTLSLCHSDGLTLETDYPIPNDEASFVAQCLTVYRFLTQAPFHQSELDRLDLQHHLLTVLFGGNLHFAPLKEPRKILDLGTGTGIWAIDMADLHPRATVIGTDLSPVQPQW